MKSVRIFIFTIKFLGYFTVLSQSLDPSVETYSYHLLDRREIQDTSQLFFTHSKPYSRQDVGDFLQALGTQSLEHSSVSRTNQKYLSTDLWAYTKNTSLSRKTFLKHLYLRPSDLFFIQVSRFTLHINPILSVQVGYDIKEPKKLYRNTRGAYLYGKIGKKIGFYTYLTENQTVFPQYIRNYIQDHNSVPFAGFHKPFGGDGNDFMTFRGYLDIDLSPEINLQFGHGKQFIGNGCRSLILSDFSNNYLFLKLKTQVWKFQYTNLFAKLTSQVLNANQVFPVKYLAFHHLSLQITPTFNIGLSEAVVIGRPQQNMAFDLSYLNPIIFYRAVEFHRGSPDNVLLNLDFKWNIWQRMQLYGQFSLDELIFSELFSSRNWWGNKFAAQLGLKYLDLWNIDHLDLQLEGNLVRPFMYSHSGTNFSFTNYQHYQQALAHPMGANFWEIIAFLRYQFHVKWILRTKLWWAQKGEDVEGENNGGDIFKDNTTRTKDFGHSLLQGKQSRYWISDWSLSYQWRHNFFVELNYFYRSKAQDNAVREETQALFLAVRWNFPKRSYEF